MNRATSLAHALRAACRPPECTYSDDGRCWVGEGDRATTSAPEPRCRGCNATVPNITAELGR